MWLVCLDGLVTFHCLIKGLFLKVGFIKWFCISFVRTTGNVVSWSWAFFLQNCNKSGFLLKFGSFEYLWRTTLIPCAISSSIICISSTVRWSISRERLLIDEETVEFVLSLCLSMCVLVMSSWCIFSTNCANGSCGYNAVDLWFAIFFRVILSNCGASALTSASFICALRISGSLLTHAFEVICSFLSASVFIYSPELRVRLFGKGFCLCLRLLIIECLLKFTAKRLPVLFYF